jgi:hypothetical protein
LVALTVIPNGYTFSNPRHNIFPLEIFAMQEVRSLNTGALYLDDFTPVALQLLILLFCPFASSATQPYNTNVSIKNDHQMPEHMTTML